MKKEDLRTLRTRKSIYDAFLRLSENREVDKITIQDIAEEAMINRNTFYLHFEDKPSFMEYFYKGCLEDLKICLSEFERMASEMTIDCFVFCVEKIFNCIDKHTPIYNAFMVKSKHWPFLEALEKIIVEHIQLVIQKRNKKVNSVSLRIVGAYFASGLIGVILLWMNNRDEFSVADITHAFHCLYYRTFKTADGNHEITVL